MAAAFDVIVVGAGMAGASVSAELSAEGKRVLLLEKESQPGYHSTGRSAAAFIPSYGSHRPPLNALTRASLPFFAATPNDFSHLALLRRRGLLTIMNQMSDATANTLASDIGRAIGAHVPVIQGDEVRAKIPLLGSEWDRAVFEENVFDIDVDGLLQAYLKQCRTNADFRLESARVQALNFEAGQWLVTTDHDTFTAPVVVNAAGAWADELAKLAGIAPKGLQPLRRTAVLIKLPQGVSVEHWPMVLAADESFYLKPDAGLLLASPADEHPSLPCDARPEELDIAYAAHYAEQALGIKVDTVTASWAGLRTFAPDRVPVVGFDAAIPGFFWLAGQGGYGIQTAPAMAKLSAALICADEVPEALRTLGFQAEWVSPQRFQHSLGGPEQAANALNISAAPSLAN